MSPYGDIIIVARQAKFDPAGRSGARWSEVGVPGVSLLWVSVTAGYDEQKPCRKLRAYNRQRGNYATGKHSSDTVQKSASRKYEVQPAVPDQLSQNLDQTTPLVGVSHLPESPERKMASITAMFFSASSSETGTSASPRTALEKTSP